MEDIELREFVRDPREGDACFTQFVNLAEGTQDLYPSYVIDGPHAGVDDLGRSKAVVTVIALRERLDGTVYLAKHNVDPRNVFIRDATQKVEAIDGPADAPRSLMDIVNAWQAERAEFRQTRTAGASGGTVLSPSE